MTDNLVLSLQRSIPVRHETDVFVAGGGPAGMAAAVTAARQGCRKGESYGIEFHWRVRALKRRRYRNPLDCA